MDATVWTIIGIGVTIVTFVIVYWRTNSARKEREKHVHKETVKVVARLLAQENYVVELSTIESLVRSKSRENGINLTIGEELQKILDDIITKFTENEFIISDTRKVLIEKTTRLQDSMNNRTIKLEEAVAAVDKPEKVSSHNSVLLGLISALFMGTASVLILYFFSDSFSNLVFNLVIILSTVLILSVIVYFYNQQITRSKKMFNEIRLQRVFASLIIQTLSKNTDTMVHIEHRPVDENNSVLADFVVQLKNGEKIPIMVKTGEVDERVLHQIEQAMQNPEIERGLVITKSPVSRTLKDKAQKAHIQIIDGINSESDLADELDSLFSSRY